MDNTQDIRTVVTDADARKDMQVEVYNNFEELETIQQEWDDFIESVGSEIFLTYDWCRIWWKYYGRNRDLRVFIFRGNNELVGIIPLFFERLWLGPVFVRAIRIVGSDFTLAQFSVPIHSKYIKQVIHKLFFELLSEEKWDVMHVGPVVGMYDNYDKLTETLKKSLNNSYYVQAANKGVQTYFPLADSWEAQLASLSKNGRRNIIRNYSALGRTLHDEPGNLVSHFATNEDFDEVFTGFVQMHQSYWQKLGKPGCFRQWPAAFEFHSEMAKTQLAHNRLRLMVSNWGNHCLGYEYAYKFGDKYFAILNSRSESEKLAHIGLGEILFSEQLKKAFAENIRCVDTGRGKFEHKLRLGGKLFDIMGLYVIPRKINVRMRVWLFGSCARLLNLCYYRIWYSKITPKLPLKPCPLWKTWIRTCAFS